MEIGYVGILNLVLLTERQELLTNSAQIYNFFCEFSDIFSSLNGVLGR